MTLLRTLAALAVLAAGGTATIAAADAGMPPIKPPRPLPICLTHYETDFIEGAGKVLYFIDSRCHKHFVRIILS